ncbi:cellulose synthase/poly-beta-1,6-N-acetylglucosamine synthase-like glycosyltransferase [Algoriphagus ratkowskyi]|uniref:Glycosyltransferase n=1 Tax=Algoriphagus ratkowskyi TaxID=57028 RepID=A0A2W7RA83_9BACT|nr:glycosyltransferase [Algoriphagus ratkowskyi]PZX56056.1 cellulose synthase/poly-beta-1,6-N-acetylglucosamine synthase-like glycosyltransferase [Algoriphagus ratkowskyi]TXD77138.1 glycosyltransferase [Algoriphagus ratkowskyi]
MIVWICYGIVGLILAQFVIAVVRIEIFWKDHPRKLPKDLPLVSVLVAARNEEKDLPDLLRSLEQLDYLKDQIQLLFVDDQSTDGTSVILEDWCKVASNRTFITISSSETALYNENGKANALAILEERATGDYYFFTDADCDVNPDWIREGVSCFGENVGIVIGITQVKATGMLEKFQEIDWWLTLGFVKVATDLNIPTTGLGNNMVISKEAYQRSGGFKNLPFCLTEDLEISRAIQHAGYSIVHQVSPGMLVKTKAETSFMNLLHQRKRWLSGVMTLPFYWKLALALQVVYFIVIVAIMSINVSVGLALSLVKIVLQGIFLARIARKSGAIIKWIYLLLFDFYNFYTILLTILYYFWPSKTQWKSRIYP